MNRLLGTIFALCLPALAFAQDVPRVRSAIPPPQFDHRPNPPAHEFIVSRNEAIRRCKSLVGWATDACTKEIITPWSIECFIVAFDAPTLRHERGHCNQFRAGITGDVHPGWIGNSSSSYRSNQDGNQGS